MTVADVGRKAALTHSTASCISARPVETSVAPRRRITEMTALAAISRGRAGVHINAFLHPLTPPNRGNAIRQENVMTEKMVLLGVILLFTVAVMFAAGDMQDQ